MSSRCWYAPKQRVFAWLQAHCPRIAARLSIEDMRGARERLARREPHNAHDFTYLRTAALAAHAREHGYHEEVAHRAFEVFLAARNEVEPCSRTCCPDWSACAAATASARSVTATRTSRRIGLDHLFSVSLNAGQLGAAKPARLCFERLAAGLAVAPAQLLYVGDDPRLDVRAAHAAGLKPAWMNRRAHLAGGARAAGACGADCLELAAALGA